MNTIPIIMPQLGVNDREITVLEWLLLPGSEVHTGQTLAHVETSKATLDLHSEGSGYFYPLVEAGMSVSIGEAVALIASRRDENVLQHWKAQQTPKASGVAAPLSFEATARALELMQQHGIEPARLPQGRIIREKDVLALLDTPALAAEAPQVPEALARRVAIFGASQGGHAVLDCLRTMEGYEAVAFLDDAVDAPGSYAGLPVWPGSVLEQLRERGVGSVATHIAKGSVRLALLKRCRDAGILPLNTIHARAIVAPNVTMGLGNLVKAGAVLDTEVRLGDACIIDNGAIVPHHNRIGNACHLAPGATLGGDCSIGDYSVVGIGATVSARLNIGRNVIIGAGACVMRDLPDNVVVEGNPARIVGERK